MISSQSTIESYIDTATGELHVFLPTMTVRPHPAEDKSKDNLLNDEQMSSLQTLLKQTVQVSFVGVNSNE